MDASLVLDDNLVMRRPAIFSPPKNFSPKTRSTSPIFSPPKNFSPFSYSSTNFRFSLDAAIASSRSFPSLAKMSHIDGKGCIMKDVSRVFLIKTDSYRNSNYLPLHH